MNSTPVPTPESYDWHSELLNDHLSEFYDPSEIRVFHEVGSKEIPVHVYLVDAARHDFKILLTSGMSFRAMEVPDGLENPENHRFAELMMLVPKDTSFGNHFPSGNPSDWMLSALKQTARFPHEYSTWFGLGHTLQASRDLAPYSAETRFAAVLFLSSPTFGTEFTEIQSASTRINLYSVFPLYGDELQYKVQNGFGALMDLIREAESPEVIGEGRPSLVSGP